MTQVEFKGKTYRVTRSQGFAGSTIFHVEVLTVRGWRITNSRSAVAAAVIAKAGA